jgi:hypothetical protein
MDAESRLNFLNFLNAQDPSEMSTIPRIPRGLRVSLQGADGPVSLDLFHTRIPSQDSAGDYCFSSPEKNIDFSYCFNHVYSRYNHVYFL